MRLQREPETIFRVGMAYGGMWYAITDATKLGFRIELDEAHELAAVGEMIRVTARAQLRAVHPDIAGEHRPVRPVLRQCGPDHARRLHRRARPL